MQVLLIMLTLSCAYSHILEFGGGEIIASDNDDTHLYVAKEERLEKYAWSQIQSKNVEDKISASQTYEHGLSSLQQVRQIQANRVVFTNLQSQFQLYDATSQSVDSYMEAGYIFKWNVALQYPYMFMTGATKSLKAYNWATQTATELTSLLPERNMYIKITSYNSANYAILLYLKHKAIQYFIVNKANPSSYTSVNLDTNLITFDQTYLVAATVHQNYMIIVASQIVRVYQYSGVSMNQIYSAPIATAFNQHASNTLYITDEPTHFYVLFGLQDFYKLTVRKSDNTCSVTLHSLNTTAGARQFAYYHSGDVYVFDQGVSTTVHTTNTDVTAVVNNNSTLPFMIALAVTIPSIILAMVVIFLCCTKKRTRAQTQPYVPWNIETIMKAQTPFDFKQQEAECPICLDAVKTVSIKTRCEHVFHNQCMRTWLQTKDTCPMCRTPLLP